MKLYELSNQYLQAIDSLFTTEDKKGCEDLLEAIEDGFNEKCIAVAKYIKSLEAEYAAIKQAADDMAKRAKSVLTKAESLTEYLLQNIQKVGLAEIIKAPEFDIKLAMNPPSLVISDSQLIPDIYKIKKEIIEIDKNAIKQDIKEGFEVEGCSLISKQRLVIK